MRRLLFLLCLSLAPGFFDATADAVELAQAAAPATVLDHRLEVSFDSGGRLTTKQTWVVRVDDPAGCVAGLRAPIGLAGASDAGARMLGDTLLIPADAAVGAVFTLTAVKTAPKGAAAGHFLGAPDLPTLQASVSFQAPMWVPISVEADLDAEPALKPGNVRKAQWTWTEREAGRPPALVWSTWTDWIDAGARFDEAVNARVGTRNQLGRRIGADISALSLTDAVERVWFALPLGPGAEHWETAPHAAEIAQKGGASATERALVLLSLLRAAGYDARPARFRPADAGGAPTTLPVPALFAHPAIAVVQAGRTVWIDPAVDTFHPTRLPAALNGSTAWIAGDLPMPVRADNLVDGAITVVSELRINPDGSGTWTASWVVSGAAETWLRERMAQATGRQALIERLVRVGHPAAERVQVDAQGLGRADKGVRITVTATEPGLMLADGLGEHGVVPPLFAPALAGWVPAGVQVQERLTIGIPSSRILLATQAAPKVQSAQALVARSSQRSGARVLVTEEWHRQGERGTATADARYDTWVAQAAREGVALRLSPPPTPEHLKAIKKGQPLGPAGSAVAEVLLHWRGESPSKGDKALKKAVAKLGVPALLAASPALLDDADPTLFDALWRLAPTDTDRIAVAHALVGRDPDVWRRAASLTQSGTPEVRVQALLLQATTQPAAAPEGATPWKPLAELEATLTALEADPAAVTAVRRLRALAAVAAGDVPLASALLEPLLHADAPAALLAAWAWVEAEQDAPLNRVLEHTNRAAAAAGADAAVLARAALAVDRAGELGAATRLTVDAARADALNPARWAALSGIALRSGRLGLALAAARRASDLDPSAAQLASTLGLLGVLAHDAEARDVGAARGGTVPEAKPWPPPVQTLLALAPPEGLLAVLAWHDAAVTEDARLLGLRAQLRADVGEHAAAARDGYLLTTRHDQPRGFALAYGAQAGRVWSTAARDQLNVAARRDVRSRALRMEVDLLTSAGQPQEDARQLGDDPRAQVVLALVSGRLGALPEVEGWPTQWPKVTPKAPRGLRPNAALSKPPGVTAWSDPERGITLLHIAGTPAVALPPPLAWLYTPRPAAVFEEDRLRVQQLDGGQLPVFIATTDRDGARWVGVGFTAEGARRALALAP